MDNALVDTSNTFSQINELIGHLIWPLLLLIFAFLFKGKISLLLNNLKKIKFSDIEAEFNEREKKFAEQDISPLNDEIDGLHQRIAKLEKAILSYTSKTTEKLRGGQSIDEASARNRILDALENNQYRWRSIPKLASISGVSEEEVLEILRKDSNNIVLSKGKSGRRIARLKNK